MNKTRTTICVLPKKRYEPKILIMLHYIKRFVFVYAPPTPIALGAGSGHSGRVINDLLKLTTQKKLQYLHFTNKVLEITKREMRIRKYIHEHTSTRHTDKTDLKKGEGRMNVK